MSLSTNAGRAEVKKAEISPSFICSLSFLRFFLDASVRGTGSDSSLCCCKNFISEKTRSGTATRQLGNAGKTYRKISFRLYEGE